MSNSKLNQQEVERINLEVVKNKSVTAGHRSHFRKKICATVDNMLTESSSSFESELLSAKRKTEIVSKLDEELFDNILHEDEVAEEMDTVVEFKKSMRKERIEIEQLFARIKNIKRTPAFEQSVPLAKEREKVRVNFQQLYIEKLNGDSKWYRGFGDGIDLVANGNSDLTDAEKFTYLRSYLTGDAPGLQVGLALKLKLKLKLQG